MAVPPAKNEAERIPSEEASSPAPEVAPETAAETEVKPPRDSEVASEDASQGSAAPVKPGAGGKTSALDPEKTNRSEEKVSDIQTKKKLAVVRPDSRLDLEGLLDAEDVDSAPRTESPPISLNSKAPKSTRDPASGSRGGSAIVQYHELVQRLTIDGVIEDWAWDQLDIVREDLGISDEAHEQIVAELITEDSIQVILRVDAASSQGFILGERCTMVMRLDNLDEQALDTARIWYASSASQGRQKFDLERLGPGERRRLVLPFWPDASGMHEMEGILEVTPLLGSTRFLEFGPLGFRVGRRPAADLNLELDPSPVHIQRQPLTRGDPLPSPGLLGPPQWRGMELRRIRRGAANLWLKRHPIRHPSSRRTMKDPTSAAPPRLRIAAVQAMWGETPAEPPPSVAAAWQGPPLRTIFRECLDTDGLVDRYHSLFEVLAGEERLLATTAGAAFGAQLRTSWEWIRSPAYGAEVCRQIRRHGVEHVQQLLCAPTGWQGQPASFKRRDISGILGHSHDRLEEMTLKESRHPSIMATVRRDGSIDSWNSRKQELTELCQLCSLLIDAFQNIRELDYLKRHELDNMAWSTRRDGLVLYLETAQLLKTLGFEVKPTMRTVQQYHEDGR